MHRYRALPSALFTRNRDKFRQRMQPGAAAVFFSNAVLPVNADAQYTFQQDTNFYYLTGLDQEDCLLFLFPDAPHENMREALFVRRTNEHIQAWEGWKYNLEEAAAASGIARIHYIDDWEPFLRRVISHIQALYLDLNEHDRNAVYLQTPAHSLAQRMQREYPAHTLLRANPILHQLRAKKEPEELAQLQEAIHITEKALRRVLGFVRPGVWEYEIEAEIQHEFLRNAATGPAYNSIIASGRNSCILHYIHNSQRCQAGDVLLMDFGARYGLYNADLTRTIPVNGHFTKRQRQVYDAVLRVNQYAETLLQPGISNWQWFEQVGLCMQEELLQLGLITQADVQAGTKDRPAYKKYFMHGIGHGLGLDVHDLGSRYAPFEPGMVLTNEPGIYIPEEGIGIRLENNVLVTDKAPVNLMANIPIAADDIEQLMNSQPVATR